MPDQVLQNNYSAELSLRIIVSVVIIVNILITVAATALWRSFSGFKQDQRRSLRDFVADHHQRHEEIGDQIDLLFERDRTTSTTVAGVSRGLEDQIRLCSDHRVHCSGRRNV